MRTYILAPVDQDTGEVDHAHEINLTEDDIQDICTGLVKTQRRVFAEQIAEKLAPEETQ